MLWGMAHPEAIEVLLQEHERTKALLEDARLRVSELLESGAGAIEDGDARGFFADLDAYLAIELEAHIEKEERALFPPLRGRSTELLHLCDDMVVQHDEIKVRRARFLSVLEQLADGHEDVRGAAQVVREAIRENGENGVTLRELWDALFRLDAMLQGHFDDEEGELFPLAEEELTAAEFERIAEEMRAIEARAYEG